MHAQKLTKTPSCYHQERPSWTDNIFAVNICNGIPTLATLREALMAPFLAANKLRG